MSIMYHSARRTYFLLAHLCVFIGWTTHFARYCIVPIPSLQSSIHNLSLPQFFPSLLIYEISNNDLDTTDLYIKARTTPFPSLLLFLSLVLSPFPERDEHSEAKAKPRTRTPLFEYLFTTVNYWLLGITYKQI
ncbi:hypothetical protein B0H19DRAFT_165284 [Mycena capillaripes]|nr:hypothetical protein B0H19DRAFT_165284 [Mycena capillaripes]